MAKPERHSPFAMSAIAAGIGGKEVSATEFRQMISVMTDAELPGYLRSYVRGRVPVAFQDQPMLWEAIRRWIAIRLGIDAHEIGLSGSAQLGFSASPRQYGKEFSKTGSDLDLFLVNERLYDVVVREVIQLCAQTDEQVALKYANQIDTLRNTVRRGFFDLKHVPAFERYPVCSNLKNLTSMVVDKLRLHEWKLEHSYFRIYRTWTDFSRQTLLNYRALK